jgi:hypothetical protein
MPVKEVGATAFSIERLIMSLLQVRLETEVTKRSYDRPSATNGDKNIIPVDDRVRPITFNELNSHTQSPEQQCFELKSITVTHAAPFLITTNDTAKLIIWRSDGV